MLLLLALPALADDREDEMFGDPAPPAEVPAEEAPAEEAPAAPLTEDEAALFGGSSEGRITDSLLEADDRIVVGGLAWLQMTATSNEDAEIAEDVALASPSFMDLFLDARPNDRVRVYTNARLNHDWTAIDGEVNPLTQQEAQKSAVFLDQLWLKGDAWRKVYFTVGKQRVRWGTSRFWNPTDFLNQQRLDPLAVFDVRRGVSHARLHVPVGASNFYAAAVFEDVQDLAHVGGAVRAETVLGPAELAVSGALQKDQPVRLGADVSAGVWLFDLHVEGAVIHKDGNPHWEGTFDLATGTQPTAVDRSDQWIPQVVAGAEIEVRYNEEDTVFLGVEGFYNGQGYGEPDLYPWLLLTGQFQPFYLGEQYLAAYALLNGPGNGVGDDLSFTGSFVGNLSDQTSVVRLDAAVLALTFLRVNVWGAQTLGDTGEFRFRLDVPPIPTVEGLEDGLKVPATTWSAGAGARVDF